MRVKSKYTVEDILTEEGVDASETRALFTDGLDNLTSDHVYSIPDDVVEYYDEKFTEDWHNNWKHYLNLFLNLYSNYKPIYYSKNEETTIDNVLIEFKKLWDMFCASNSYRLSRYYLINVLKYNPFYNVDGEEIRSFEDRESATTYGKKNTHVDGATSTSTNSGQTTTETKDYSTTGAEYTTAKVVNTSGTGSQIPTNTTSLTGTTTDTGSGTDTTKQSGIERLKRFGNIGVTMTQQLADAEMSLADTVKFWEYIFGEFVSDFFYYYSEVI